MLLWPFNKYPGTDYETFNWEWLIRTVKDYTAKVDDFTENMTNAWDTFTENMTNAWDTFTENMTNAWDTFRNYINHEIAEMHRKFAIYVNVTEGALNTGAIANGAITKEKISDSFLPEIENVYVTPEMFGAVGDGQTDDTQALTDMFNSGAKRFELTGQYRSSNLVIESLNDAIVNGGELVCDSHDTQYLFIKLRECKNTVFNGLAIRSTNDQNTYVIPGFPVMAGSKSSNIIGLRCEKCENLTFNDMTGENLLVNVFLGKNETDLYSDDGNKNINFNDLVITGAQEGVHSSESNGVHINGLYYRSADICGHGYHAFYFERNSKYLRIENADIDVATTSYTVFDFADHHEYLSDMYDLAVDLINCTVYAFMHFQFNYENRYCHAENCHFKTKKWTAAGYDEYVARFVDIGTGTESNHANIIFTGCVFEKDGDINTNYLTRSEQYASYEFYDCDIDFRINTTIGKADFHNCKIDDIFIYIFAEKHGIVRMFNCIWDASNHDSYLLAIRTTAFILEMYNCLIMMGPTTQFINNSDVAADILVYGSYFDTNMSAAWFQIDDGTGVVPVNSYWNNTPLT